MGGKPIEADVLSLDSFERTPKYAQEFIDFIDEACTVYHTAAYFKRRVSEEGFVELKEGQDWTSLLHPGGKYFVTRGSSALIAFSIGAHFTAGDPFAMIGSHIDALCMKVKPHSKVSGSEDWERLGVAPYSVGGAGVKWDASFSTWWDRDLGCGGKVLVKGDGGKVEQKLIRMPGAVARIPTLATHFGEPAKGPFNYETQMIPILGLNPESGNLQGKINTVMGKHHSARFLRAIASSSGHGVKAEDILDFSLELFDAHPATLLGLSSEFISAPRMDDRLCSFAAIEALVSSCENEEVASFKDKSSSISHSYDTKKEVIRDDKVVGERENNGRYAKLVALFDTEEVGSVLRVGAKSNFLRSIVERVVEAFVIKAQQQQSLGFPSLLVTPSNTISVIGQTLAKSFLISADVSHAINPNFDGIYLEGASPGLNKGPAIYMDPNGHMTSEPVGATLMRCLNEKVGGGGEVQILYPRNDSRTGGTIGPTLSQDLGVRAIDMGIPMMSMHSIRAITGSKDIGIAVRLWSGFFDLFGSIDLGEDL